MICKISIVALCFVLPLAVHGDNVVCADGGFKAESYDAYYAAAENVAKQIDRAVGSSCVAAPRKFVNCRNGACADAEVLDGCRTANDLKHTLYNARDHVRNHHKDCHNVRIISHGGAVASRVRKD